MLEGNIIDGIDRLAILSYFEMQFDAVGIGITHPRNGLPAFYHFPFFHQQSLVMAVGGQVGRIVLDDNQVAVAAQSVAGIHHFTVCSRHNGLSAIVYSDETKELIENLIKKHDPKAFTDEGNIKSYEIDPETISANPMGGIMFSIYINNYKDSYISVLVNRNNYGDLVIESYTITPTLFDIWGLDQNN